LIRSLNSACLISNDYGLRCILRRLAQMVKLIRRSFAQNKYYIDNTHTKRRKFKNKVK